MGHEAVLWTLAATLLSGLQLFFQKVVAQEKRGSALNGVYMYGLSGLMAFVLALFFEVPNSWLLIVIYAVVAGTVHAIGNFVRIEGLRYIDSVLFFPLNKVLGPIVVIVGSIVVLGESLTKLQVIGVLVSVCVPLLLISRSEKHRQQDLKLGLIFLVVSTVLTSASQVLTKIGIEMNASIFFMLAFSQFSGMISSLVLQARSDTEKAGLSVFHNRRDWELGIIAGVLGFTSFYSLLKAMNLGQLSIVYTIHAHYILIPIILSVWWYKEHIDLRKLLAVAVSFLAIGLLI